MSVAGKVLFVDDDRDMCELVALSLRKVGFEVLWTTDSNAAFATALDGEFDCIVTDLNMKGLNGLQLTERIVANRPGLPVVVLTAFGSFETAVAAMRAGAYDFATKPVELDALTRAVTRAVEKKQLADEVTRLRKEVLARSVSGEMLGSSMAMQRVYSQIAAVAPTSANVLISGEPGTGKALVARAIVAQSRRSNSQREQQRSSATSEEPHVIACAALPRELTEPDPLRMFDESVAGQTVVLDEIGSLSLELQANLIERLERNSARLRVISTSTKDLERLVEEGSFREDLHYRLAVVEVAVPPLRVRGGDIAVLAHSFLRRFARAHSKAVEAISAPALGRLSHYSWPGNVRELEASIERAVALTTFSEVRVEDLPDRIRQYQATHLPLTAGEEHTLTVEELERRHILAVLEKLGGSRTDAAKALGLDRKTLYRKLLRYGFDENKDRE